MINLTWISKAYGSAVAFSKKNLPTIMIGASIVGFWTSIVMIAKEAPKAKAEIEEKGNDLPFKDKAIIYGKHCWKGGLIGLASTGLGIGSNHINLERLAGAYMLTQMYKDDGEKLKKQILKQESGEKELNNLKKAILEEDYPDDVVDSYIHEASGNGHTLFIDKVTGAKWMGNIVDVMHGIDAANEALRDDYEKAFDRANPFFSKDGPFRDDPGLDVFGTLPVDEFLDMIGFDINISYGETMKLGELLEFRSYSRGNLLKPSQILEYKNYIAPGTDQPKVCFLDYFDLVGPSSEILERYP